MLWFAGTSGQLDIETVPVTFSPGAEEKVEEAAAKPPAELFGVELTLSLPLSTILIFLLMLPFLSVLRFLVLDGRLSASP